MQQRLMAHLHGFKINKQIKLINFHININQINVINVYFCAALINN